MSADGWRGRLTLHYRHTAGRTTPHDSHEGPLRVLQALYPEGQAICHHVLVHPPGGVVGGDVLDVEAHLGPGSHAVVTTPGATRFYRSEGALSVQRAALHLAAGARLEWLPLEAIAHSGCEAANEVRAHLAPGAEMIGWDLLALGLPASGKPFDQGSFSQHLELPGVWLDRGRIRADDGLLLRSAVGFAGHPVLATLWFAAGTALAPARRDGLLDAARGVVAASAVAATAGATSPQTPLVVLRVLAPQVQAAMQLLVAVRGLWRQAAWGLPPEPLRIWRT